MRGKFEKENVDFSVSFSRRISISIRRFLTFQIIENAWLAFVTKPVEAVKKVEFMTQQSQQSKQLLFTTSSSICSSTGANKYNLNQITDIKSCTKWQLYDHSHATTCFDSIMCKYHSTECTNHIEVQSKIIIFLIFGCCCCAEIWIR